MKWLQIVRLILNWSILKSRMRYETQSHRELERISSQHCWLTFKLSTILFCQNTKRRFFHITINTCNSNTLSWNYEDFSVHKLLANELLAISRLCGITSLLLKSSNFEHLRTLNGINCQTITCQDASLKQLGHENLLSNDTLSVSNLYTKGGGPRFGELL